MAFDITFWNRLESRAKSNDFSSSFRAAIKDPLWMLSRQWQMGEFEAEDKGSPVFACVDWRNNQLNEIALADGDFETLKTDLPIETEVERVGIARINSANGNTKVTSYIDITQRIDMGRYWFKLLDKAGLGTMKVVFQGQLSLVFKRPDQPYNDAFALRNRTVMQYYELAIYTKSIDGAALYKQLKEGKTTSEIIEIPDNLALNSVGVEFVGWMDQQYNQPEDLSKDGWDAERMEYQVKVRCQKEGAIERSLQAKEYYHGRLDWHAFDYEEPPIDNQNPLQKRHLIPNEVAFPGMPKARWWEFEDFEINLSAIEANLNQTGKLILSEFGMLYSNDWFFMPLRVPVGSFTEIDKIIVTDTFGQRMKVQNYDDSNAKKHWAFNRLFTDKVSNNNQKDQTLFIPSTVLGLQESKPIEQVNFMRDEMANKVWGIESIIPDGLGGGANGYDYATSIKEYYRNLGLVQTDPNTATPYVNEATISYEIGNTVPENWIPFIPTRLEGSTSQVKLQRATMPRVVKGIDQIKRVRPLTRLLQYNMDRELLSEDPISGVKKISAHQPLPYGPYYLYEEEVPRSGVAVKLTWQRVRWYDGKIVLWLGYRKTNGRGEGNSGLRFDQAIVKEATV